MPKTVWILGAGFSAPLGGPLLKDLFSKNFISMAKATFETSSWITSRESVLVQDIWNLNEPEPGKSGYWRDAEDFLDRLDTAARKPQSPTAALLRSLAASATGGDWQLVPALSGMARRLVAAQCWYFVLNVEHHVAERWQPYKYWASQLTKDDTIISFNYDRVLESVSENVHVLLPDEAWDQKRVLVLKLHGSVDWEISEEDGKVHRVDLKPAAVLETTSNLAIGTPGPKKQELTEGPFHPLWNQAKACLLAAERIVFLGFRFPPSDSIPRRQLLSAIGGNRDQQIQSVLIHTVLGDDVGSPDSRRLRHLLGAAMQPTERYPFNYSIMQHPFWCQDFLDLVWSAKLLDVRA